MIKKRTRKYKSFAGKENIKKDLAAELQQYDKAETMRGAENVRELFYSWPGLA